MQVVPVPRIIAERTLTPTAEEPCRYTSTMDNCGENVNSYCGGTMQVVLWIIAERTLTPIPEELCRCK